MAVSVLVAWGQTSRPWGYEVRVNYRDSLAPAFDINEVLEWRLTPTAQQITDAIEARRARVEERLVLGEEEKNIADLDAMTFVYTTPARMRTVLRIALRTATGLHLCRLARWMYDNLTLAQLRSVFNVTDVTQIRARLLVKKEKIVAWEAAQAAVDAEAGE